MLIIPFMCINSETIDPSNFRPNWFGFQPSTVLPKCRIIHHIHPIKKWTDGNPHVPCPKSNCEVTSGVQHYWWTESCTIFWDTSETPFDQRDTQWNICYHIHVSKLDRKLKTQTQINSKTGQQPVMWLWCFSSFTHSPVTNPSLSNIREKHETSRIVQLKS